MLASVAFKQGSAFLARQTARSISGSSASSLAAGKGQAEVILVGCGAPNRGTCFRQLKQLIIFFCWVGFTFWLARENRFFSAD
jgi:hypothetical protein